MNPVCSECGGVPVIAHGLCRKCYDAQRLSIKINVDVAITPQVKEFADNKRWSMPRTLNYLIGCGLKWEKNIKEMKEKYGIL